MVVEDGKPESEVADFELSIRDRKRNGRGGARGCGAGHGDAPVDTRSQKEWSWRTANLSLKWPTLSCRYAIAKGMVVEVRVAAVPGMEMPRSIRDRKRNGRGGRDSTTSPCHRVRSIRDRKRNGRGGSTRRGPTEIVPRVDTRSQKEWSWRSQGASTPSSRAYRRYAIAKGMVVEGKRGNGLHCRLRRYAIAKGMVLEARHVQRDTAIGANVATRSQKEWSWRALTWRRAPGSSRSRYAIAKGMVVEGRLTPRYSRRVCGGSIRDRKRNGRGGETGPTTDRASGRSIRDRKRNGRGGATRPRRGLRA